ncbi:BZ3500_MvSof-1268-A1-R1_C050g00191 [Microbotryum saponariae]|uniref:BZ3500_MvSof-1268-A1-R1_C050g00191 protein n=1 Tax=Microbotryum saponariae TaxID=289078 RepID=A0A2X0KNX8_9BASI|nr:BZ3500_MvSof-1268-A1-R1_C050g00191 [Microbotryum saponariae]
MLYSGDSTSRANIINGFLTAPVRLTCGLGQGTRRQSSVWDIVFQPFLMPLHRRNIALNLSIPALHPYHRAAPLHHLHLLMTLSSPSRAWSHSTCSMTWRSIWRHATNGRLNTDKTVSYDWTSLGPWERPIVRRQAELAYANLIETARGDAGKRFSIAGLTHHTRAFYVNRYAIPKILHFLAADIPPPEVVKKLDDMLVDFVRGGKGRTSYGRDIDAGHCGRGCGTALGRSSRRSGAIWQGLARASLQRAQPDLDLATDLWPHPSTPIPNDLHPRWHAALGVPKLQRRAGLPRGADLYRRKLYAGGGFHLWTPPADVLGDNSEYDRRGLPQRLAIAAWYRFTVDRHKNTPLAAARTTRGNHPQARGPLAMEQRLPDPVLPQQARQYTLLNMARPYTVRRIRRVLNAKAFTNMLGLKGPPQPDDLRSFWKAVNSKALTAREREVWFKLILRFTPTRKLQHEQKHDTSPACFVCEAPVDDTDHYFFGCFDSRNVWIAARGYTTLQRLFGLPKLKAKLSAQEGAGRTIEIFTGMVLEMISSGRWRMQKHGTRMESVERRRVVLEERMKLRAGGARGRRGSRG